MADFWFVLTNKAFWQLSLIVCLLFTVYIVFLSTTSVLFVVSFTLSTQAFALCQGALLLSWLAASLACSRLMKLWHTAKIKQIGTYLIILGALFFFFVVLFAGESSVLLTLSMMVYTIGSNWAQGIYFPEAMEYVKEMKGAAASVLTSLRLLICALFLGITARFYNETIYPIAWVLLAIIATVVLLIVWYERSRTSSVMEY
jgi:MFS transporter, DHA1 family, multidrug resistance protein